MSRVTFNVFRFDPETDAGPRYQKYEIDQTPGLTVLGGLLQIQARLDPSLAFRSACRAAVCGSCAMHINGQYRLACETQTEMLGSTVTVRPLGHLVVIKDLVVEMKPFWDRYKEIKPYLIPGDNPPGREFLQSCDDRERLDGGIDCILCSCCYNACPVVGTDPAYVGPAAALKASRFLRDSRDRATQERLLLLGGDHGVWRCHTVFSCQEVCPKDLNPTGAIAEIKMEAIKAKLRFRS
jgi:succinate dehydrogenase / fumarate reductase iron-sulfur subunit